MQRTKQTTGFPFTFGFGVIVCVLFLFVMLITLAGQNKNTSLLQGDMLHQARGEQQSRGSVASPASPSHIASHPSSSDAAHTASALKPFVASAAQDYSYYVSLAQQDASAVGISPYFFVRQIQQESGFNPWAVSPAGAIGIAQFMPGTASDVGINPYDPVQSLSGAASLMANLSATYGGDYAKALAAYNAGPGAVNNAVYAGGANWLAYMPAETQNYVNIILYA